jgi:cobalt-zinc-cadmium efflux system membrane fusion protein
VNTPTANKNQYFIGAILVIVIAGGGYLLTRPSKTTDLAKPNDNPNAIAVSAEAKRLASIETAPVKELTPASSLHVSGQISFPTDSTVNVAPSLTGRVRQVFVTVGDHVSAGQTLALIGSLDASTAKTTDLQNQNKLRIAKENLDRQERLYRLGTPDVTTAQAALEQAKETSDSALKVLRLTRQQDSIGGFTQKPVEDAENALITAKSSLSSSEADFRLADKDLHRKIELLKIGVIAKADLEASQDNYDKAKSNFEANRETVRLAQQALDREKKALGTNLYSKQQLQNAETAYRQALLQQAAAEKALRLAKAQIQRDLQQALSDYRSAQFEFENSTLALKLLGQPGSDGLLPVKSPIDGIVTARNVSTGTEVDQSQETPWQLFTVSDPKKVWIECDVYEKDIAAIHEGFPAAIKIAALPGTVFKGKVIHIAPTLDPKSRSVKVRIEIPNPEGRLRDGEFAEVAIDVQPGSFTPEIRIPLSAVQHDATGDHVFVKSGDKFQKRDVKLGSISGQECVVLNGLKPDEVIVTQGAIFLGDQANND